MRTRPSVRPRPSEPALASPISQEETHLAHGGALAPELIGRACEAEATADSFAPGLGAFSHQPSALPGPGVGVSRLRIPALACEDCRDVILELLEDIPGVYVKGVSPRARTVTVRHPSSVCEQALVSLVTTRIADHPPARRTAVEVTV